MAKFSVSSITIPVLSVAHVIATTVGNTLTRKTRSTRVAVNRAAEKFQLAKLEAKAAFYTCLAEGSTKAEATGLYNAALVDAKKTASKAKGISLACDPFKKAKRAVRAAKITWLEKVQAAENAAMAESIRSQMTMVPDPEPA